MKKLLVVVALLLLIFASAAGAVSALSHSDGTHSLPIATIFTENSGMQCHMPCLFGVRPGITTFDQAIVMLQGHPMLIHAKTNYNYVPYRAQFDDLTVGIQMMLTATSDGIVDNITLRIDPRVKHLFRPTLGESLALFGTPEHSMFPFLNYYATLYYKNIVIAAYPIGDRLSLDSPISMVAVSAENVNSSMLIPWRGFSSYARYNVGFTASAR